MPKAEPRAARQFDWFRWLWRLHRWIGITAGAVLMLSAISGFLLLIKKDYAWLQPPMLQREAPPGELQPLANVFAAAFAAGAPELRAMNDVARVDFRPDAGVHKVVSRHGDVEVQVCAVTLRTNAPAVRRSDWLERLHDGSWLGGWMHDLVMPAVAIALLYLGLSGYLMWAWPKWRKRRRAA
jgi:uncharacterized iron-regulated membrane protein